VIHHLKGPDIKSYSLFKKPRQKKNIHYLKIPDRRIDSLVEKPRHKK
jgi:hypothetical protein